MTNSASGNSLTMRSTTWLPMKPAPPVTTTLCIAQLFPYFYTVITYGARWIWHTYKLAQLAAVEQKPIPFLDRGGQKVPFGIPFDQPRRDPPNFCGGTISQIEYPSG